MNQTTILLTRTILSAASQIADSVQTDSGTNLTGWYIGFGILCFLALASNFYTASLHVGDISRAAQQQENRNNPLRDGDNIEMNDINPRPSSVNFNHDSDKSFDNLPRTLNNPEITHITTPDMALPQPNPRFLDNGESIPHPAMGGDTVQHDQTVDITDNDILDLTNHVRNLSKDRTLTGDIIRPDSATLPPDEGVDLTEVLSHLV